MREDRILRLYGFLHLWLFETGILLLMLDMGGVLNPVSGAKLFCLPIAAVILRETGRRGKKLWSYLGVSLLLLGAFWLLGGEGWEQACLLIGLVFYLLLFFCQRFEGNWEAFFRPSYICLLFFALEYGFSLVYGLERLERVFLFLTVCYWLLILWSRNREHYLDYCGDNQKLYRFPGQRIAYGSRLMLAFLTALTGGCMLLLPFLGVQRAVLAVLELLRRIVAMILSMLNGEPAEPGDMIPEEEPAPPLELAPEGEPSPFLEALWDFLEKLLTVALVLALAVGICAFFYWLYKRYNSQALDNGDILESLETSGQERREKTGRGKFPIPQLLWARNPNARIRRAYRQKILRKGKPLSSSTPEELEDQAGLPNGVEREEFHRLYEQARYGKRPCTQEEARRMRELERVDFS